MSKPLEETKALPDYIKFVKVCWRHSLYDPVFTGGKVIFGCIDEGNPEVEHQIDDQRTRILCQKDLEK